MTEHQPDTAPKKDGDAREQWDKLVAFLRRAVRFWPTMLVVMAVGALAAVLFLVLRQPEYRSETLILYTGGIRPVDATADPTRIGPRDAAVRLREMLMARPRLTKVIDQFGLYPEVMNEYGDVDAVEEFREHIDFRAPGGDTFAIGFKGDSPEQARAVTAELAESLIRDEAGLRRDHARQHKEFLVTERKRTEESLKKAEREVAQFLADHPELAADAMLLMPGAPSTGAAIRAATAEPVAATPAPRTRWRTVTVPSGGDGPAASAAAPIDPERRREIAAAKTRADADLAAAQSALAEKASRFTRLHPDVRALEARVARERARVEAATAALASLDRATAVSAGAAEPARRVVRRVPIGAPEKEAEPDQAAKDRGKSELVELETDWARLTRAAAEARAKNDQVEASLFKAELASKSENDGSGASMVVLDPAYLPARPTPPGRLTIAGIFAAITLLFGGLIVSGRAAIDDRIYRVKDMRRLAPVLGEVPPIVKKR